MRAALSQLWRFCCRPRATIAEHRDRDMARRVQAVGQRAAQARRRLRRSGNPVADLMAGTYRASQGER